MLYKKRIDIVNQAGVVGERNVIAMYQATIDSRLLPGDAAKHKYSGDKKFRASRIG